MLSQPLVGAGDPLAAAAAHANQITGAALAVALMCLSLAMVPVVLYPVLRRHSQVLALGYVVFRGALETVIGLIIPTARLLLVTMGRSTAEAGASAASGWQASGALLLKASEAGTFLGIVFCLGALMFYTVLYRSWLVPRWLSAWGLVGVAPYLAAEFLPLFTSLAATSTIVTLLYMPLALQEMVLAVWLIVKGFQRPAVAAGAAQAVPSALPSAA